MTSINLKQYVECMEKVKPTLSWDKLTACENVITNIKATQMYKDQTLNS